MGIRWPARRGEIFNTSANQSLAGTITFAANNAIILPLVNDAATPTLAWGDGDTGFYESSDDVLRLATGGTERLVFLNTGIDASIAGGPRFGAVAASSVIPSLMPNKADADTGTGWAGANLLSLIAGGVEGIRIAAAAITVNLATDFVIPPTGVVTLTTTAALEAVANAINTSDAKILGFPVFNTDTAKPLWATGSADNDVWNNARSQTTHTPIA